LKKAVNKDDIYWSSSVTPGKVSDIGSTYSFYSLNSIFYHSIPWSNLYTFFTTILSVALPDAILTHSLSLYPHPPYLPPSPTLM